MGQLPARFDSLDAAVDAILATIDGPIRLGAPLGLGKPHRLLNASYARIEAAGASMPSIYDGWSEALGGDAFDLS